MNRDHQNHGAKLFAGKDVPRRDFLRGAAVATGATGAMGLVGSSVAMAAAGDEETDGTFAHDAKMTADENGLVPDATTDITYLPRRGEYPTPSVPEPDITEYSCDVLVVGGGLAGLNAAWAAAQAGSNVILVEKATPGYGGLSAWPSCTAFYDPELDADMDLWDQYMRNSCECFANLNWEDAWCAESKSTFQRLCDWGWIQSYPRAADTEYWVDGNIYHDNLKGYKNSVPDRRKVFGEVLDANGVTTLDHVMVTDIIEKDGTCVGAVCLHYQSETVITITAKAVVLATGNGVLKPMGYPIGSDTYDGLWIGYQHGLPVTGLEFEDFHMTTSYAPSNGLTNNAYPYLEPVWPTGGTVTADNLSKNRGVNERYSQCVDGFDLAKNDVTLMDGQENGAAASAASQAGNEDDPRKGKMTSPLPKGHVYGAAIGMSVHTASGIWCGIDDLDCFTGMPGLYAAGDGTNGCYVGGPCYGAQRGSTSSFMSMQGAHAGSAAAAYAATVGDVELPADEVKALQEKALQPTTVEKGFNPEWIREVLHSIMAPNWVNWGGATEATLNAALTNLIELRDQVQGRIYAQNGHALRLAHEVEHMLLVMELKLRVKLERKESRGHHYRRDYPSRDDNYLYYITMTKGADGEVVFGRVELPERWTGDLTADYTVRYPGPQNPLDAKINYPQS